MVRKGRREVVGGGAEKEIKRSLSLKYSQASQADCSGPSHVDKDGLNICARLMEEKQLLIFSAFQPEYFTFFLREERGCI